MRARQPDRQGYVERDGVKVYYESHGTHGRPIVFAPTDLIVTSEMWKAQVPYLARSHQVVIIDPRGNGRSDKPTDTAAYSDRELTADLIAVMDELGIDHAVTGGICEAAYYSLAAAAWYPDRIDGVVAIGSWLSDGSRGVEPRATAYDDLETTFYEPYRDQEGWSLCNRDVWLSDWPRWPRWFFHQIINDPHSTKVIEDLIDWACQSTGAAQVAGIETSRVGIGRDNTAKLLGAIACPVLSIHGTLDNCQPFVRGAHAARWAGGELLALGGAGHVPTGRDPIAVNHAIADFVDRVYAGAVALRPGSPARVRAHLSTRRDAPPAPANGRRIGRATAYGQGAPRVVMLAATGDEGEAWAAQLPGVVRQLPTLVLDPGVTDAAVMRRTLTAARVSDGLLVAPPGAAGAAAVLATDLRHLAGVLLIEAPTALAEQPGLLEFFVHRLPLDPAPASIVRALTDVPEAESHRRVPVVAVVDDPDQELRTFVDAVVTVEGGVAPATVDHPATRRRRRRSPRVLYLSSPIGLGHVRRDLAIAGALRREVPGLQVDWLSQSPVTDFLTGAGEQVHPASAWLASESGHIEAEAGEHDLHAFQALRRMDEILVNNFHVFDDLVREQEYDAWVGDEAWDLDHFLHENPRLKRAPFVWMTDFVGWVPMPDGGEHEAYLAADYNAEMVRHVDRYPGLRDRSVFVGDPEDVIPGTLGPGLPEILEWTRQHFAFCGYVMGERPDPAHRDALRARLGYRPDDTVCVVSVGGSAVGEPLLRRVVDAYDACRSRLPSLQMHVVTGPRVDPDALKAPDGITLHGFLPDLDLHHAACDIAVVQGGLSTTMELTAAGRPFLYFPLRHHFEQQFHVRHRLDRHRAGRAMDYATADADTIAEALVDELAHPREYLPVPEGGAERAATLVAELL